VAIAFADRAGRRYRVVTVPVPSTGGIIIKGAACAVAAAVLSAGCASLPASVAQSPPAVPAPPATYEYASPDGTGSTSGSDWYRDFGSDELLTLIAGARDGNTDLAAAQARILQADARARAAGSALLPTVQAGGAITQVTGRSGSTNANETDWSALLSASYEIDFWGRNRAGVDSANALARASRADRETLWLTLESSIAGSYFRVLALRERLAIATANLQTARQVLQVIEARYNAGAAGAVELATQRATVANAELALPELQQQEVAERGALALLAGHDPEQFTVAGAPLATLQEPVVAALLPSQLLTRRPDLLAAEASLGAAHADLRAAQAALFPMVALTGSGGVQNPAVRAAVITLGGIGSTLTVGASIIQTIFDDGRRRAVRAETAAREQELLANYRSTIRSALLDVETALSAIQHLEQQRAPQAKSLVQSTQAFNGAELRYRAGSGDYLTMLEAQRLLYAARDQASAYRLARLQALISLGKALGGGWQAESLQTSGPTTR
jgi:NodT family efflux transporter outer membrane factor (OMF) lipoprotein